VILEKWIIIRANPLRPPLARSSVVEHTVERWTINIISLDSESDNHAGVLIHYYHNPVCLQRN
jgi:hypothetical protein